jgi:hypothetical protein
MTGDMPACSQRYFSLAGKRHDFKDIAEKAWGCCEVDVKGVSGRSKKLDSRVKPGNDDEGKQGKLWILASEKLARGVSVV